MNWIFIGMIAGSLVTSTHDNKEACLGRQALLKEKGIGGQCLQDGPLTAGTSLSTNFLSSSGVLCTVIDTSGKCLR